MNSFFSLFISLVVAKDFQIDVAPGYEPDPGYREVKHRDGPMQCRFQFAAQGGTNEAWTMSIERINKSIYSCIVARPSGTSYLYATVFYILIVFFIN